MAKLKTPLLSDKQHKIMEKYTVDQIFSLINAHPAVVEFLEHNIKDAVFLRRADARRVFVKQAESLLKLLGGE